MKPMNMKTLALLSLLTQIGTLPLSQMSQADSLPQPNAFTEGTVHAKLTQSQIDQLLEYVNQSQARLEQAMSDAANRSESEQARIYLEAVKSVVLVSYQAHPGTELLMRVILNQALALTYGVPKADGNGFEKEGVLARSGYQAILPSILKDSITLALKYVDQDRQAVKTDQLFDLPYAEMAYQRLLLSQEWMRSILEQDLAAAFGIESLEQWLSSMVSQDQQHQAKFAGEITFVTQALSQVEAMSGSPQILVGKRERFARVTMRKLTEKMEREIVVQPALASVTQERASPQRCSEVVKAGQFPGLETSCLTSKGVWFRRVKDHASGETGWKDSKSGRIVFDGFETKINQKDSEKLCLGKDQILPSQDDWNVLEGSGVREIMPDGVGKRFWSSTPDPRYSNIAIVFNGYTGKPDDLLYDIEVGLHIVATRCLSPVDGVSDNSTQTAEQKARADYGAALKTGKEACVKAEAAIEELRGWSTSSGRRVAENCAMIRAASAMK